MRLPWRPAPRGGPGAPRGVTGAAPAGYNPPMATDDERFMTAALAEARRGRGAVEPNPMVGAVLVRDGTEIARGFHERFGGPHAEVQALAAARASGADTAGATMYVTLEPCCHQGKTPPCTRALIDAGVTRVVAAMEDPDGKVAGRGLAELRAAGVAVTTGPCLRQARALLAPYVKLRTTGRPWVICKWAQTPDGLLALPASVGRWLSCEESRARVHDLRGLCDGICVGAGTVAADDPVLTNRSGRGRRPVRVVLDSSLRTPPASRLVRTVGEVPLMIATTAAALAGQAPAARSLRAAGAELLELPPAEGGVDLEALLNELGRRRWTHLLVEGGAAVLGSFIKAALADELLVFICPARAAAGAAAVLPRFDIADVREMLDLGEPREQTVGIDTLLRYVLTT